MSSARNAGSIAGGESGSPEVICYGQSLRERIMFTEYVGTHHRASRERVDDGRVHGQVVGIVGWWNRCETPLTDLDELHIAYVALAEPLGLYLVLLLEQRTVIIHLRHLGRSLQYRCETPIPGNVSEGSVSDTTESSSQ